MKVAIVYRTLRVVQQHNIYVCMCVCLLNLWCNRNISAVMCFEMVELAMAALCQGHIEGGFWGFRKLLLIAEQFLPSVSIKLLILPSHRVKIQYSTFQNLLCILVTWSLTVSPTIAHSSNITQLHFN